MPTGAPASAPLRIRLTAWAIVAIVVLAAAELAARIIFPLPEIVNVNRTAYSPQMVSGLKQSSLGHASFRYESAPDNAASVHYLNLYGFRDSERPLAKQHSRRLLFVGDSMVEGFLAAESETIPRVFEAIARAKGSDIEVWNLGVGGAGLGDYVALIQDAVPAFAPDELILVLHANDLLGSPQFTPSLVKPAFVAQSASPWMPRLVSVAVRAMRGEAVPRAWHDTPFMFFAAVPNAANPWSQNGAAYAKIVAPAIATAMREGHFNPFNVAEVQTYEHYLSQPVDIAPWFAFFKAFLDARGVTFRIAYIPQPAQTTDYYMPFKQRFCPPDVPSLMGERYQQGAATATAAARSLGIPFLDLTPAIRAAEAQGRHLYWNYDEHLRPAGYAFVANAIYDWRSGPNPVTH